jgi:hypothetical protein
VAVYVALCWCGEEAGAGAFRVDKALVMRRARIQGRTTYYKTMKELDAWGYVKYEGRRQRCGGAICLKPSVNLDSLD